MTALATPRLSVAPAAARAFSPTTNPHVRAWVETATALCRPDWIVWCDGSVAEHTRLTAQAVEAGVLIPLNRTMWPGCHLHRTRPDDTAAVPTFLCTADADAAGPTNPWMNDRVAAARLEGLFDSCMRGRTMYVVPFLLGPVGSPRARVGVLVTDSLFAVLTTRLTARVGPDAWEQLGASGDFARCTHSVGDLDPARRIACHFPAEQSVWSFGSDGVDQAALATAAVGFRLASAAGRREGWLAEHMAVLGVDDPYGETTYVAAAFPDGCGKSTLATLTPPPRLAAEGWAVRTVADDVAWLWVDGGQLRAIDPTAGVTGLLASLQPPASSPSATPDAAAGAADASSVGSRSPREESAASAAASKSRVSDRFSTNRLACIARDAIFVNAALLPDGDVWWPGRTPTPPAACVDWQGTPWTPARTDNPAHPAAGFIAPVANNPLRDAAADDPAGVPVSAILFGGRRRSTIPLVFQAFDWLHGVYLGATLGSEVAGVVRRDPMAIGGRLGYNVRDYFVHWLRLRKRMPEGPCVFHVNLFREDDHGRLLWPGFGENLRLLRWVVERCHGRAAGRETPIGWVPTRSALDCGGLRLDDGQIERLQAIDSQQFRREVLGHEELFLQLAGEVPKELILQRELLIARL